MIYSRQIRISFLRLAQETSVHSGTMRFPFIAVFLLPVTTVFAGDCGHFSVGECKPSNEQIVGSQPIPCQENQDANECIAICQKICSITSSCDFFSYDTTTYECTMLTERKESDFGTVAFGSK